MTNGPIPNDILKSIAEDIKRRVKTKVLIFGPGHTGGAIYIKRCEIKDKLKEQGYDVYFGEDVCNSTLLQSTGLNLLTAEYITCKRFDYIVCLMTSPGSIGEVHDFAGKREIASKMMICIDSKHRDGYTAQGVIRIFEGLNGKVDWFKSPKDIKGCHLLTRILEQVRKVAEGRQLEIATGGKP